MSSQQAREQLALMYVNPSRGILDVHLVEEDGEKKLVVDVLATFWDKVGGSLPKTWGGLYVCVALFDAAGGRYPDWVKVKNPGFTQPASTLVTAPVPVNSGRRLGWAAFFALMAVIASLWACWAFVV